MATQRIKYTGRKGELRLRHWQCSKGYDFLPENGMVCEAQEADARYMLDTFPGIFKAASPLVGAQGKDEDQAKQEPTPEEKPLADAIKDEETANPEAGDKGSGPQVQDAVAAALHEMRAAGYKLPRNLKNPETIMKYYAQFRSEA